MSKVTVIGTGNMGSAIAAVAAKGGADVQIVGRDERAAEVASQVGGTAATVGDALTGDIVVLAVPYPALAELAATYGAQLDGKVVVDITNPLNFETFDSLTVAADGSAAAELQALLPNARVLKAFNTTFAATLATGTVGDVATRVLVAGDDADAKALLRGVVEAGGLASADAGSLKRARELEAIGFLQLTLAVSEQIAWTGGFAVVA